MWNRSRHKERCGSLNVVLALLFFVMSIVQPGFAARQSLGMASSHEMTVASHHADEVEHSHADKVGSAQADVGAGHHKSSKKTACCDIGCLLSMVPPMDGASCHIPESGHIFTLAHTGFVHGSFQAPIRPPRTV